MGLFFEAPMRTLYGKTLGITVGMILGLSVGESMDAQSIQGRCSVENKIQLSTAYNKNESPPISDLFNPLMQKEQTNSMQKLIETFYQAFAKLDAETMVSCYHDDITFQDPAFGVLKGEKAKNMWRMLCESQKGQNFIVESSKIVADEQKGAAHWEAHYTFGKTGRKVHNIIEATFEFKDGKIVNHIDDFSLHKWSKQALGFTGLLLGGTNFFKKKLNAQTNKLLTDFEKKK